MKSVCVVGSGPGGLVVAKTLLQTGKFTVTIYETADHISGIWGVQPGMNDNEYLSIDTASNLSRNTVVFSDLSWESVGFEEKGLRMFPRAGDVCAYLEEYRRRYIPSQIIKLGHRVLNMQRLQTSAKSCWQVTTEFQCREQHTELFDFLVNAGGFAAESRVASSLDTSESKIPGVQTSKFRSLEGLFPDDGVEIKGKKILVCGSGNDSGETAANIAFQISNAKYSPSSIDRDRFADVKVFHVTPRPVYAIPPYVPLSKEHVTFVPLDLQFCDLEWRLASVISSSSGLLTEGAAEALYEAIHGLVGDQKDLDSPVLVTTEKTVPWVVLCESYSEFVRTGLICPIAGRLSGLFSKDQEGTIEAQVRSPKVQPVMIDNIAAIIHATDYTPLPTLSILPSDVLQALEHDPSSIRLPLLLQQHQTVNPAVPNLAFIGFYEGPYWGVMEMQARIIAATWSTSNTPPTPPAEGLDNLRTLRQAMKNGSKDVPQYWYSDYIGYLEESARDLALRRHDAPFHDERKGSVSPARYLAPGDDHQEASKTMTDLSHTISACTKGKYRARAIFRALQGQWQIKRTIKSARVSLPSGMFTGTAHFHPRVVTLPGADLEMLYIESGTFVTTGAGADLQMSATRRYIYSYTEGTDVLSVSFVKPEDALTVDYLFHELEFEEVRMGRKCMANAGHKCGDDFYRTEYIFELRNVSLDGFEVRHVVSGPNKEYVATASHVR